MTITQTTNYTHLNNSYNNNNNNNNNGATGTISKSLRQYLSNMKA
jgi:hypothetical protein